MGFLFHVRRARSIETAGTTWMFCACPLQIQPGISRLPDLQQVSQRTTEFEGTNLAENVLAHSCWRAPGTLDTSGVLCVAMCVRLRVGGNQ